jgi:predicted nucleic acid-binding protein
VPTLVDTSAWIEFFHPSGSTGVKQILTAALEAGDVVTVAPVLTELLVGLEPGHAASARAIERLQALEIIALPWNVCARAGQLGRSLARRGQRAPTVDLMIAAAAVSSGHDVWHVGDKHFVTIARAGGPRQRDLNDHPPAGRQG